MSAPLPLALGDGTAASLALAVAIGVAFGWTLERAGLGSARKLAAQFSRRDFTVLKVLFSALVTAMLGAFWLARLGVLDLARVATTPTAPLAQLVGGALFGAGFLVAGLCPGTSCVAAASGRMDGLAVIAGLLAGVLTTGLLLPALPPALVDAGDFSTLPALLGLSYGDVVALVVGLAFALFTLAGRLEARRAAERHGPTPTAVRAGGSAA
jgi:uncharacterized membrane protein YedE/YeeE